MGGQNVDRLGLVILYPDDRFLRAAGEHRAAYALQKFIGHLRHDAEVAGNIRLALRAVDDEIIGVSLPDIEFGKGGERRAAHADDARFRNAAEHAFPVKGRKGRQTLFLLGKIVLDKDMIAFLARERDMGNDALDRARDGRKDGRGQSLPRLCDERALFHLLPRLHDGNGGRADMLAERDIYLFGNRPLLDRRASGQVFGTRGMHPVLKRIH